MLKKPLREPIGKKRKSEVKKESVETNDFMSDP